MPTDCVPVEITGDDAPLFEAHCDQQKPSRRKRGGGLLFAAAALLLLGAFAMYVGLGRHIMPDLNSLQQKDDIVVRPPYEHCSKVSENCIGTKCCKVSGHKCFLQNAGYASCKAECLPGRDGWCTELVNTRAVQSYPGLRLFCFSFYTKNTGSTKKSYELDLFRTQLFLGASIFGCPKWRVYSDIETWLSPGPPVLKTTKVDDTDGDFHLFKRKKTGAWTNAMMFYQAWMDMRRTKATVDSDWVIKADADAVFIPVRLLETLKGYKVPGGGVYVENCKKVMYGFFGNLEVVSHDAFDAFLFNLEHCKATLDWKGLEPSWKYGPWGEDLFMQKCMDIHGVAKVYNFTLTEDGKCKADLPKSLQKVKGVKWQPDCLHSSAVSMHPFKKPDDYFACLANTQRTWEWTGKPWEHLHE